MPTLPDVKAKVVLDDSALTKSGKTGAKVGEDLEKGLTKGQKATKGLAQETEALATKMGIVPKAASGAATSLENMAQAGVLSGGALMAAGGIAVAAAGLLVVGAQKSVQLYTELADQVENYKRVSGSSAEESGRMVQTFNSLGVSEEVASKGMFKLSKAIDTAPAKLAALGIEVAKTKDGNVDLSATLFNVADAYNGTADAAKRNTILQTAFGKSGRDMIPVLEQGSDALRRLGASARVAFSDADLEQMKNLAIKQREVKQGWDAMWEAIGQKLIPAEDALTTSLLRGDFVQRRLDDARKQGLITDQDMIESTTGQSKKVNELTDAYAKEYDQLATTKHQVELQTAAIVDQRKRTEELVKASDDLVATEDKIYRISASIAGQRDKVTSATLDVRDAERTLAADRRKYGVNSEQAVRDAIALRSAQQNLTDIIHQGGTDRRQLVIDQEAAANATRDTNAENAAEIKYYKEMLKHVGKGSPLYKKLQEWIALLQAVPANVSTDIVGNFRTFGPANTQTSHHAAGGDIAAGEASWVGEKGPEIYIPKYAGTIIPAASTASALTAGHSESRTYNVEVNVAGHVQTERELTLAIREGIRRIDREMR